MAKAPEAAAPTTREFTFTAKLGVKIPEVIKAQRPSDLPFQDYFSENQQAALDGAQPYVFVPVALFQQRSDAFMTKVNKPLKVLTPADARSKLNDQFKKWQDGDSVRKALKLVLVNRTGKEGNEGEEEPGVGMWVCRSDQ